ncbi:hypothetical protein G9464_02360 [Halostella sp. JP-L12]|uniref:hypothetical protein n=1 Tax=Halostella TaxID=1843185 RepID=UPI000EF7D824|nr:MULTISPECIES: hypothetical protein [Halostella]NHN46445.1 hypothetical protein [Halostella sp. JP-L12]
MIFLANRANLDRRTLFRRLHKRLQTQVDAENAPIEQVWYEMSSGNKIGVHATVNVSAFLDGPYPIDVAELQVSFDFPSNREYDYYTIQWVEAERELMVGWHQDQTHPDLGECHFQVDYQGETVQRDEANFLDTHPLNVFDQRTDQLVDILDSVSWEDGTPFVPKRAVH